MDSSLMLNSFSINIAVCRISQFFAIKLLLYCDQQIVLRELFEFYQEIF